MRKALHLLSILNDSDIDWLIAAGSRREGEAGVNLIDQGRPIDSVFVVIDGAFSVRSAGGTRELQRLLAGEVAGEMPFVDSGTPPATVQALERSYQAICMFLSERLRQALAFGTSGAPPDGDEYLSTEDIDGIGIAGCTLRLDPAVAIGVGIRG